MIEVQKAKAPDAECPQCGGDFATKMRDGSYTCLDCYTEYWPGHLLVTPEGERPFKTTLASFLRDNAEDEWVKEEVLKLRPGQSVQLGGGAQPGFVVKRVRG
jgi:hypothetical protein